VQHVFGYGLIQPLQRIAGKDFVAAGEDLLIGASIRQLLGTRPGELRWAPEFGVNLDQYRHRGGTEGLADVAADDVVEGIQEWIPAVSVAYADVTIDDATLKIKVMYKAISRNTPASNVALGPINVEEEI
jgi:phage baseplate assembly protein W